MVNYRDSGWSDASDEVLRKRWLAGATATEIGDAVGRSRSAVLGRIHRLGLGRGGSSRRVGLAKGQNLPKAAKPKAAAKPSPRPAEGEARPARPVRPKSWPATDTAVALMALGSRHCRWPVETGSDAEQLFCGADRPDKAAYCQAHARMAYQKATS